MHIRCVGDFTTALAQKLGCDFEKKGGKIGDKVDHRVSRVVGVDRQDTTEYDPGVDRVLPRGILSPFPWFSWSVDRGDGSYD